MANRNIKILLVMSLWLPAALACHAASPQLEPTAAPAIQVLATQTQTQGPSTPQLTEADVPRISAAEAKAAFDSGRAIIVDVRSADAFGLGHVKGAINIPLAEIENDLAGGRLEKNQWIITYCT